MYMDVILTPIDNIIGVKSLYLAKLTLGLSRLR